MAFPGVAARSQRFRQGRDDEGVVDYPSSVGIALRRTEPANYSLAITRGDPRAVRGEAIDHEAVDADDEERPERVAKIPKPAGTRRPLAARFALTMQPGGA